MKNIMIKLLILSAFFFSSSHVFSDYIKEVSTETYTVVNAIVPKITDKTVIMHAVNSDGVADSVGTITVSHSQYGLVFNADLKELTPGMHGFHLHQNPSCKAKKKDGKKVPGLAAGGHYDPAQTNKHAAPWADGHLGDLPALFANADGVAQQSVLAPRLKMEDITNRALVIHAGGDNHSDHPAALGGGGPRMACGVVK